MTGHLFFHVTLPLMATASNKTKFWIFKMEYKLKVLAFILRTTIYMNPTFIGFPCKSVHLHLNLVHYYFSKFCHLLFKFKSP